MVIIRVMNTNMLAIQVIGHRLSGLGMEKIEWYSDLRAWQQGMVWPQ
jgi:hypothetical protein